MIRSQLLKPGDLSFILLNGRQLIAFVLAEHIETELNIYKIGVNKPFQGQGFGRQIFQKMLNTAKQSGCVKAYLELRKSNITALNFYKSFNFIIRTERKKYYQQPEEDAILMEYNTNMDSNPT